MSEETRAGMAPRAALALEIFIIGLGLVALICIFQPFSLVVFAVGSGLVVLAGLLNNLLPLAQPGVPFRSVFVVALVVAMIFCIVLLVSISAAHLYGVFFLKPPDPATQQGKLALATLPFYMQSFVWYLAGVAAGLAVVIAAMTKRKS